MATLEEGKTAVKLARDAITAYVEKKARIKPETLPPVFSAKRGVFVTIHEEGELRGCIGYPEPIMPLGLAIVDSAINAASSDPRFPSVRPAELPRIDVEVTILTKPETYTAPKADLPNMVRIGVDGLIVRKGRRSGLLLPQVAPEYNMDPLDFLSQTSLKAGMTPDAWIDEDTEVLHFQAQIFSEVAPGREVVEKTFADTSCGTY